MNPSHLTDTIERALAQAGIRHGDARTGGIHRVIGQALASAGLSAAGMAAGAPDVVRPPAPASETADPAGGRFHSLRHAGPHGDRAYKLFVPHGTGDRPLPLVVMLHGCKQNPDDFAAGTRMNALAQQRGVLVAYPEQTARANGSNCWNWFEPQHQGRGGEPALLAGIVADIRRDHAVAPGQVFVGGLSAGAAMALILGQRFPEVFSAVAAHSGLPVGAAHDVPSAFAAMQGRGGAAARKAAGAAPGAVRTLVFHGTADSTVAPANGDEVVRQAVAAFAANGVPLTALTQADTAHGGRPATLTRHVDAQGDVQVAHWRITGAGHAWSGGSPAGSYADARGPDASAVMLDFFLGD